MIAVAFDLNFRHAADIFAGVSDFVATNRLNWRIVPLNYGFEAKLMELATSGRLTGAIGTFVSDGWIRGLTDLSVIAVNLFNISHIKSVPTIGVDDDRIGEMAIHHFKEQGINHFAFYGADSVFYTRLRKQSFIANASSAPVIELNASTPLQDQLGTLLLNDERIGILCANDTLARDLIIQLRTIGRRPGKDYLVVGIDNDPSESIFAGIGLSSFKIPAREIGHTAAKVLNQQLTHTSSPITKSYIGGPVELIQRDSSIASPRARLVQRTTDRMNEQFSSPSLEIEQLAREAGLSRRGLEIAFKEQISISPYRYLSQLRCEKAKELLTTTDQTISEVGRRCGYPEPHHFSAWFKNETGMSPKKFRVYEA